MDCAELWIPPNYCIDMPTVISSVPTDQGFVIGSDGRSRGPDNKILTEDAQKVFPLHQPGMELAFGIFGTSKIGPSVDCVAFDFESAFPLAANFANSQQTWWGFMSFIAVWLQAAIGAIRAIGPKDELDRERGTFVSIGGFYRGHQRLGHFDIRYRDDSTEVTPHDYPDGFSFQFGSIRLFALLNGGDPRFTEYAVPSRVGLRTLRDGIDRVRKDILLHYDPIARAFDPQCCDGVGGRVQIATVTLADGFRWVPGFEPVGCIARRQASE